MGSGAKIATTIATSLILGFVMFIIGCVGILIYGTESSISLWIGGIGIGFVTAGSLIGLIDAAIMAHRRR